MIVLAITLASVAAYLVCFAHPMGRYWARIGYDYHKAAIAQHGEYYSPDLTDRQFALFIYWVALVCAPVMLVYAVLRAFSLHISGSMLDKTVPELRAQKAEREAREARQRENANLKQTQRDYAAMGKSLPEWLATELSSRGLSASQKALDGSAGTQTLNRWQKSLSGLLSLRKRDSHHGS